jgi:hypothetical protein
MSLGEPALGSVSKVESSGLQRDLVYEPKCGGRGGVAGSQPVGTAVHSSSNNFEYLTLYLTYGRERPY